jgi:hypothetical protein
VFPSRVCRPWTHFLLPICVLLALCILLHVSACTKKAQKRRVNKSHLNKSIHADLFVFAPSALGARRQSTGKVAE